MVTGPLCVDQETRLGLDWIHSVSNGTLCVDSWVPGPVCVKLAHSITRCGVGPGPLRVDQTRAHSMWAGPTLCELAHPALFGRFPGPL